MKTLFYLFLLIIIVTKAYSQGLSDSTAKSFINALIYDSPGLEQYVSGDELQLSKRLGIAYTDVKYKFLISNDIEPSEKTKLRNGSLKYEYYIKSPVENYSVLTNQIPSQNINSEYYLFKSKLVSKPFYFAGNWDKLKSKYFEFHISNPEFINEYSINKLDTFVDGILTLLDFNENEINKLEKEKIHYFLCKNETEIELLTNYKAKGLYYLPYDYIVSTYNCHYHEILHLLMNYKLKSISLYTLPLLQEGFAVAFGGRGGQSPHVLLGMGVFLAQSNFMDYKSLLNKSEFDQNDPSMSYPASGLYVRFLIHSLGIGKFIKLYKKYSTDEMKINDLNIDTVELPSDSEWQKYLHNPNLNNFIRISGFNETDFKVSLIKTEKFIVYENADEYLIKLKGMIGLKSKQVFQSYTSNLFNELFPQNKYQKEKYLITASADEVSVYNLYTNDLAAKYVKGFSIKSEPVIQKDGFFIFTINKSVFDEPLKPENIMDIGI